MLYILPFNIGHSMKHLKVYIKLLVNLILRELEMPNIRLPVFCSLFGVPVVFNLFLLFIYLLLLLLLFRNPAC